MNSVFGKLNLFDVVKGFLVAFLTFVIGQLQPILQSGTFPDLHSLEKWALAGLAAGLAYLLKNLFTNSDGAPLTKEKN